MFRFVLLETRVQTPPSPENHSLVTSVTVVPACHCVASLHTGLELFGLSLSGSRCQLDGLPHEVGALGLTHPFATQPAPGEDPCGEQRWSEHEKQPAPV